MRHMTLDDKIGFTVAQKFRVQKLLEESLSDWRFTVYYLYEIAEKLGATYFEIDEGRLNTTIKFDANIDVGVLLDPFKIYKADNPIVSTAEPFRQVVSGLLGIGGLESMIVKTNSKINQHTVRINKNPENGVDSIQQTPSQIGYSERETTIEFTNKEGSFIGSFGRPLQKYLHENGIYPSIPVRAHGFDIARKTRIEEYKYYQNVSIAGEECMLGAKMNWRHTDNNLREPPIVVRYGRPFIIKDSSLLNLPPGMTGIFNADYLDLDISGSSITNLDALAKLMPEKVLGFYQGIQSTVDASRDWIMMQMISLRSPENQKYKHLLAELTKKKVYLDFKGNIAYSYDDMQDAFPKSNDVIYLVDHKCTHITTDFEEPILLLHNGSPVLESVNYTLLNKYKNRRDVTKILDHYSVEHHDLPYEDIDPRLPINSVIFKIDDVLYRGLIGTGKGENRYSTRFQCLYNGKPIYNKVEDSWPINGLNIVVDIIDGQSSDYGSIESLMAMPNDRYMRKTLKQAVSDYFSEYVDASKTEGLPDYFYKLKHANIHAYNIQIRKNILSSIEVFK